MNIQEIRLDLDKRVTVAERVIVGQGDKFGTTIVAKIYDHGVAYNLSGKTARFEMRLPNSVEYVRDNVNCSVSGNEITYVVDEEHVAAAYGTTDCAYFDIMSSGNVIASRRSQVSARIPKWVGGRYDITLAKIGGQWKIVGMQQVTVLMEADDDTQELPEEILVP